MLHLASQSQLSRLLLLSAYVYGSIFCKQYGPVLACYQDSILIRAFIVCFHGRVKSNVHLNKCSIHFQDKKMWLAEGKYNIN